MFRLYRLATIVLVLQLAACTDHAAPTSPSDEAVASAAATPVARSGGDIVNQYCLTCHGRGLYNAPRLDDTAAWQSRRAAGDEVLWQSLLNGKQAMPARGSCPDCSDDELRAALNHLLMQAGPDTAR